MSQNDPGAPDRPERRELWLLGAFALCVAVGAFTVLAPELTAADEEGRSAQDAASPTASQ